jgi:FkbM family methyltransferase
MQVELARVASSGIKTVYFIVTHPLSRGRRIKNLARYIGWQIGARLVPGPVAARFVNGAELLVCPGLTGATGNIYVGLHEFEDMAFVMHFLRKGDLFVDVGANVGSYTVLSAAGIGANCIAFEPDPDAYAWLRKNIGLNDVRKNAEARQEAISAKSGTLLLTVNFGPRNHIVRSSLGAEMNSSMAREVNSITLDDALRSRSPIMLKVDVEGFESEVLSGGQNTLENTDLCCVLIEMAGYARRYGVDEVVVSKRLIDCGFKRCCYEPFGRHLELVSEQRPRSTDNALFVRNVDFVRERVKAAAPFTIGERGLSI